MSAPAAVRADRPTLRIGGTAYPVLLPSIHDPRLHLASIIITLQVLGQVAFDFRLSIAQILVSLAVAGVLEFGITLWRNRVLMWPASALLTGNGVAFVLRVPGTEHGDWWSMKGWYIFAGTSAVALLSKYVIRVRGSHVFNPSNIGLVLCFLLLGAQRADPLALWWGPLSPALVLALVLIVVGGFLILRRLHLLEIAIGFWLAFAAGIGVLAASGHTMTAAWHVGPIEGRQFWWLLVSSPEILVFLFFMITDPKTTPTNSRWRRIYAVGVGLLATLLIAPQTTEFGTKVAILASLALVCATRGLVELMGPLRMGALRARLGAALPSRWPRPAAVGVAFVGAFTFAALVFAAGIPARPSDSTTRRSAIALPPTTVETAEDISFKVDTSTVRRITQDLLSDLRTEADALRLRDPKRAAVGAGGPWLVEIEHHIVRAAGRRITVPTYRVRHVLVKLAPGSGQGPPRILVTINGSLRVLEYRGLPPKIVGRRHPAATTRSLELALERGRYVIVGSGTTPGATTAPTVQAAPLVDATGSLADIHLQDVAHQVGLDFRQGAFRFGVDNDVQAMMGGGLCWLDYDGDGWLDLFVVNSYSDADAARWESHGGLPRSALFHNVDGAFVDVSRHSGADVAAEGQGCVAADLNGDGRTDLVETTSDGDRLLWNNGDGMFTEGAAQAGVDIGGWHAGAAVADVNLDGRPDLFIAGYTDLNAPLSTALGFPSNHEGVRDLLYLNNGTDGEGHSTFREVGVQAGLEAANFSHGLGALFTDYNGDGLPDIYVANDEDPNQLYENVPWPGGAAADPSGLGFRYEERGAAEGADDPFAGMGIASGDYSGDGRPDLFVSNSRREPFAVLRHGAAERTPAFGDGRAAFRATSARSAGWGATWADLSLGGSLDLVLANGGIPITNLSKDAARVQVFAPTRMKQFASVSTPGLASSGVVNGRGLAAADYDNNGTMDVAVGSIGGRLELLRTMGGDGHWLEVGFTRFSPGAVATAVLPGGRRLVREAHAGSSYLSTEDPRLHFGLGNARKVRLLVVRFPGGAQVRLRNVRADRVVSVTVPDTHSAAPADTTETPSRSGCSRPRGTSVAQVWDQDALDSDPGATEPNVQARNLFHLSAAMWDAWAAYAPRADGYFVTEKHRAADTLTAREAAISYAAYRLLLWRASYNPNMRHAFDRLTSTMRALCFEPDFTATTGNSPAALGNRIAAAAIAYGRTDGSLETQHYLDPSYVPVNDPLVVSQTGAPMHDRTFWQPLALGQIVVPGGLPSPSDVQAFVGSQWGLVHGFALPSSKRGVPIDPGPPPIGDFGSAGYKRAALAAIQWSSRSVGTRPIRQGAVWRTPPGRWNEVANAISNASGRGSDPAERLARDVRLYLALNGALHDAAVATWGVKREYQSVRPISMIRSLALEGQSSDPRAPSYKPDGLPLVPGLVELITRASSAPGQRHAALAGHVGDVAVRTSAGWVLGTRWLPRGRTVTPPYPGWVSDESAFARAALEILTTETGSAKLPTTYGDAGVTGLKAGTETPADVRAGRRIGAEVGKRAWALAQRYIAGTAP